MPNLKEIEIFENHQIDTYEKYFPDLPRKEFNEIINKDVIDFIRNNSNDK